ncbi:MAG: V-type ATPase subunit [Candidatus Hydrothermarchaeales archaeon]
MSVSTYAYVNARIGGMKSYLLRDEDLRGLIESRNLEELVSLLKNTRYGVDISEPGVLSMELQLKRSLYRDYLKLINSVEGRPKSFVQTVAKRFEVETLKSIIKMKFLKIALSEYLIPFGQMNEVLIERLMRAEGISSLIEEMRGTEYRNILKKVRQRMTEKKEGEESLEEEAKDLPYLNALEEHYFTEVKESMEGLSKKDKAMVKRFVGFNIDISNFLMGLRLRGIEEDVGKYFLGGGESFTLKHFSIVTNLENLSRLPDVVPRRFVEIAKEALERYNETKSLLSFELVTKKQLLKESRKLFLGARFHIGTIIAYLNLKENEISNLIKIIKTKDEFFDTKEIEKLLVYV